MADEGVKETDPMGLMRRDPKAAVNHDSTLIQKVTMYSMMIPLGFPSEVFTTFYFGQRSCSKNVKFSDRHGLGKILDQNDSADGNEDDHEE
jgi:hypothetical protein